MLITKNRTKLILTLFFLLAFPVAILAVSEGELRNFNIDSGYDLYARQEIEAQLIRISHNLYFYIEKGWWKNLSSQEQNMIRIALFELGEEFQNKIYPVLTTNFGQEPKPGIDKDEIITVLIHQMLPEVGGYSNSGDVYSRFQYSKSNEREMVYLNSQHIASSQAKSFLAHEFMHLITVNQKDLLRRVTEEIWLNEARAEYAPTLLGYNDIYKESLLERRVKAFLENPAISLTEWLNKKEDYGAINLFAQYLVDHYGKEILIDSLLTDKTGIASLEEALLKNGFQKNFSQIFTDWMITLLVNDCKLGEKYCYLNKNLRELRISPTFYYLPQVETVLSTYHLVGPWNLNWQRFVGGGKEVSLEFDGSDLVEFEVPYLLCDLKNNCQVGFLGLGAGQTGKLSFSQFNTRYISLTTLPFIKSKTAGFISGKEDTFPFSWQVSVKERTQTEEELRNQLLARIAELQEQVRQLQAQLKFLLAEIGPGPISCQKFNNNLYYGMRANPEVRCLQEFLKTQGVEIYPQGLVTGNFLSLTQAAVIRFQEKYASEILEPLGLEKGTGYFGPATRAKINELLK